MFVNSKFEKLHIGKVLLVPIADVEVFPSVTVKVHQQRRPTPVGIRNTGELTNFRKGTVAIIELEHVAHGLVVESAIDQDLVLVVVIIPRGKFNTLVGGRQHVQGDQIRQPIVVDIGNIGTHGKKGDMTGSLFNNVFKRTIPVI